MSAQDMKNLDDQVLEVANSSGTARTAADAKACCNQAAEEEKRQREERIARKKMQDLFKTLIRVTACLLAIAVFLALMLDPTFWVPVIGCTGIITFVVVGAISIERYLQRRRRYGI